MEDQKDEGDSLRDFQRERREGTLIMKDEKPFLILAVGKLFHLPKAVDESDPIAQQILQRYKIENKFDLPVGYKAIMKWFDDEIVFMTRKGRTGPEFQTIYLPKSAAADDFTIFEWSSNVMDCWEPLLTILEQTGRDTSSFNQGPFYTFGVCEDTVQIGLKNEIEPAAVERVLYAKENEPTREDYLLYLDIESECEKALFSWIPKEMQQQAMPANVTQHVTKGMVFWQNSKTRESTWKHPHYDKYKKMVEHARIQRPLHHWKAIAAFEVKFFFFEFLSRPKEVLETIDNVLEFARIFKVDCHEEPYLVHVLRHVLRHYHVVCLEQKEVRDIEDFRDAIEERRDTVKALEQAKLQEVTQIQEVMRCCECDKNKASVYSVHWQDLFCQVCYDRIHSKGNRKYHKKTFLELEICTECDDALASFFCSDCRDSFCRACFQDFHKRGGRKRHLPICLRSFHPKNCRLPSSTTGLFASYGASQSIQKALSPWFEFEDENMLTYFINIETRERRRDRPLDVINEPLELNEALESYLWREDRNF